MRALLTQCLNSVSHTIENAALLLQCVDMPFNLTVMVTCYLIT